MRSQPARLLIKTAGLIGLLLALAALSGCGRRTAATPDAARPPLPVRATKAVLSTEMRLQPVSGTVHSLARARIAARISGRVIRADFTLGQTVVAGDTVVVLNAPELDARVAQAQAALDQAEHDYRRESGLLAKGASTPDTVSTLALKRRMAAATLDDTRALLGYTQVTAPFAGVITSRFVNAGDLASPGTPLFGLEGPGELRAEVEVPESLATVPTGTNLAVQIGTKNVNGTLAEFSPAADPGSRTRLAKVALPDNAGTHPGEFVSVLWPAGDTPLLTVPEDAVSAFGQIERVFVVTGGRAVMRLVKTGLHEGGRIQILSGLEAGETVVIDAPPALRDGGAVSPRP